MASRPLDSKNPAVRAIERWKRGIVALVIVGLVAAGSALLAAVPIVIALELLGAEGWAEVAILIAALTVSPWAVGNRNVLQNVGSLDVVSDD